MRISKKNPLSSGEKTGIGAFALAGITLVFAGPEWSILPLLGFVMACLVAPFLTGIGFFLPVISRGDPASGGVALTFDDGPDGVTTPLILDLLKGHGVVATFFGIGENVGNHPDLIRRILKEGHTLGNHTQAHDPLIMLKTARRLRDEIVAAQKVFAAHGIRPLVFRPPAGITNPKLGPILYRLGLMAVNFSCRALDGGNRRIAGIAIRILGRVRPGDIIMLHDCVPRDGADLLKFLAEIDAVLNGLKARNLPVIPLSDLIGIAVMDPVT